MYGDGWGWGWGWMIMMMMVMLLFWVALIAVIVWVVIRLVRRPGEGERGRQDRETPQEVLDRRFARGEIDAEAYKQARAHLSSREPGAS